MSQLARSALALWATMSRSGWFYGCVLVCSACSAPADVVASATGDFDPKHPPRTLTLSGSLETHNPTLFRAEGKYFVYSTGVGIAARTSTDMRNFEDAPRLFDALPLWLTERFPDVSSLWAPTVAEFGERYHLYFAVSAAFGGNRSCIGHATAVAPSTGFTHRGPIVCSSQDGATDDFDAIDPGVLVEDEHNLWLVFGSYLSGIKLVALDEQGERRDSKMYSIAGRPGDNQAIQGSSLTKRGDYYYLFASFDSCCMGERSTYYIVVGRAKTVTGPYIDRDGVDMRDGGGSVVLTGDARWRGPGSNEVFTDGTKRYTIYHAYDADASGRATLRISELYFDNDGWPVTSGP